MRTVPLICAMLLFKACQPSLSPPPKAPDEHILGNPADSSPIIISDGQITINHKEPGSYFRVHAPNHASMKLADHNLSILGYGCDPTNLATCSSSTQCTTNNTAACYLNIDPTDSADHNKTTWTLYLCDSASCSSGTARITMTWNNTGNDVEKIDMKTTSTFTLSGDDSTKGPALLSGSDLMSAQLSVAGSSTTTYNFVFNATITYMRMLYICNASGNNTCAP
jgi:hypothetical protein